MTPGRFAATIFDMDGTLVDTEPIHRRAWMSVLPELGVTIGEAEYAATFSGRPGREIARLRLHASEAEAPVVVDRVMARFWQIAADGLRPMPGVVAFLDSLGDLPLAVATSNRRVDALRTLSAIGLLDRFRAVVTVDDVTRGKPHPEPFLCAAAELGVRSADCVAFEDSANGLLSARAAGMFCVGIASSTTALAAADIVVAGFDDPSLTTLLPRVRDPEPSP